MIGEFTNHLWQSTLLAVAMGLLTMAFTKNGAKIRYCLWLIASFKFLIPFTLLISLGTQLDRALATRKVVSPSVSFAMVKISRPFPDSLPVTPSTRGNRDLVVVGILGIWACGFSGIAL